MSKTKRTETFDDDFFDDAATAQYLIARLIEDALADFDDEETSDLEWTRGAAAAHG